MQWIDILCSYNHNDMYYISPIDAENKKYIFALSISLAFLTESY